MKFYRDTTIHIRKYNQFSLRFYMVLNADYTQ